MHFDLAVGEAMEGQLFVVLKVGFQEFLKGRFGHSGTLIKESMFIFGGWDGWACLDDFYEYSISTNIWYEIRRSSGKRPSPRYRHGAAELNNSLFIFGGFLNCNSSLYRLYLSGYSDKFSFGY